MRRTEVDEAILSYVSTAWMKVAMVIAGVAKNYDKLFSIDENDFEIIAQHIELLIEEGSLLIQGNLKDWRHSEIRKP